MKTRTQNTKTGNQTQYTWEQINNALMNTGMSPKRILRTLSALKTESNKK